MSKASFCGYIGIVGRPNVGKSTLLNALIGKPLAITSHKAQTTRHVILGIKTLENKQLIYVDTPGMHQKQHRQLNRVMNRSAEQAAHDVDVVLFVVEARRFDAGDEQVLSVLKKINVPVILVLNKIDQVTDKEIVLPKIAAWQKVRDFAEIFPLSAFDSSAVGRLEKVIASYLPENPHFFPAEQLTDRPDYFIVAEKIREKLFVLCQEEIPYSTTVTVEKFDYDEKNILHIHAVIWVERDGQKAIVIGKKGEHLKHIATNARKSLEAYFNGKIFLQLWVKVKSNWADDQQALKTFGLINED